MLFEPTYLHTYLLNIALYLVRTATGDLDMSGIKTEHPTAMRRRIIQAAFGFAEPPSVILARFDKISALALDSSPEALRASSSALMNFLFVP